MYPNRPEMDFECACPVRERKNIWNDITGVHVRYCPACGERRESFYEPTQRWEDTGRGKAGEPEPSYIRGQRENASRVRGAGVRVVNPKAPV